ncbi:hypothetical protein M747DRAFT_320475 [Aspergillus niger ATCC 13496]|uniref:UDP-Glycosyltransferase/glycogen phosphorylase n=1 Tax=Aspergillus niger ATCC 13496 TaxID=1353008 RepID=A0A370CC48_ASPNG|nr:hypothetical protein M747DRAFT_320475 [Aspergillus niger ATCC 13496]
MSYTYRYGSADNSSSRSSSTPCILFLTNSEREHSGVTLAVVHEFLIGNSPYKVHIGSFGPLKRHIAELNYYAAASGSPCATEAVFEEIPGMSMKHVRMRDGQFDDIPQVGFFAALKNYRKDLALGLLPWTGDDYVEIFDAVVELVKTLGPVLIVVDPLFAPAVDVCRICSGFKMPMSLWDKLRNIFLGFRFKHELEKCASLKGVNDAREARGIEGPVPFLSHEAKKSSRIILPSWPETDFPLVVPEHMTLCGPILRRYRPMVKEDPELAHWLSKRPTVLVLMDSRFSYDGKQQIEIAKAIQKLLEQELNMQVLWKLKHVEDPAVTREIVKLLGVYIHGKRMRIAKRFVFEIMSLLMSGHVTCLVHHGGANVFHEAVRAEIPQIVLPVWFDAYDYAARVEYLGIGIWGSRRSAPKVSGEELGDALLRVVTASDESHAMRMRAMQVAGQLPFKDGRVVAYERLLELLPPSFNYYSPNKSYNPSNPSNSSLLITITTTTMANERITWIGLGNIGRAMAANIAQKGPQTTPVTLYNRTTSKATDFASTLPANKATVSTSLSDAISNSTIIFICVGDDAALEAIISGLPTASLSSKIIVDCSTVHPDTSRKIQRQLASHGASFIACPVFGAPAAAIAGQLVVVPAGDAATIDRIKPFLDGVTSKATISMAGEDVGRATTLKILGNTFILNTVETVAEGLVTAEKTGLGADVYQQFLHTFFPGPFALYADRMVTGDYHTREEPLFAVDLARKDLRHASSLAGEAGVRLRSVEVTDHHLQTVKAEKGEKGDIAAVYGSVRKESGLPFEN